MSDPTAFIDYIFKRIQVDKGFRAALRRADNPSFEWHISGLLRRFLGDEYFFDDIRHAYAIVAAAAARSSLKKNGSYGFGKAMHKAVGTKFSGKDKDKFPPRFSRILSSSSFGDLIKVLRPTLQLIDSKSVPLDYSRLLTDLMRFRSDFTRERVRIEWAADYSDCEFSEKNEEAE